MGEPLESFFEFGDMQSPAGASKGKGRGARVRFGTHTAAEGGEEQTSGTATVGNSGIHGRPAIHFTVEGDDAVSGIRAARTYMLSSLTNAVIPSRPDPEVDGEDDEYEADLRRGAAGDGG